MFLLSVQKNFYIILSLYVEWYVKKNSSLNFMSLVGFQASYIGKFTVEQVLKSFSGRINSLEPLVFGFSNSVPYVLEELGALRSLISWAFG